MPRRAHRAGSVVLATALLAAAGAGISTARPAAHRTTITTHSTRLGRVVASRSGRVMYLFLKDGRNASHCGRSCTAVWPRVTSAGRPRAAGGVHGGHLGRARHHQVTYFGHPLYYYAGDNGAGQANGEGLRQFGAKWYAVSTHGKAVKHARSARRSTVVTTHDVGGRPVLASHDGHTLYALTSDSPPAFGCTGGCTSAWPPLLTKAAPRAAGGARPALLGTVTRPDGTRQVSYDGHPVYDYAGDSAAGTASGQGSYEPPSGYWYDIDPSGTLNTA